MTRRRLVIWTTLLATILAVATPAYLVTASPASLEQENEAIVHRGSTACGDERWYIKTAMDSDAGKVNTKAVVQTTIFHLHSLTPPSVLPSRNRIRHSTTLHLPETR